MEQGLLSFLTWQFLLFAFVLAGVMEVVKRFVLYFEKDAKDLKLWNDLIFPVGPVFLGALLGAVIKAYPYPEGIVSWQTRLGFGLVSGLFSTLLYRVVNGLLKAKITFPADTTIITTTTTGVSTDVTTATNPAVDDSFVESVRESINKDPVVPNIPDSK